MFFFFRILKIALQTQQQLEQQPMKQTNNQKKKKRKKKKKKKKEKKTHFFVSNECDEYRSLTLFKVMIESCKQTK